MKKVSKSWKSFDFGPDKISPKRTKSPNDHMDTFLVEQKFIAKSHSKDSFFDFFSDLIPKTTSDLAVHSKKIEEVKVCLERILSYDNTSFLVLSGPTGCGKTATLNVLCKEMGVSISEWINPIDQDFELVRGPNQVNRFLEFISTESNYTSLFEVSAVKKIVLVEDFPNVFVRNNSEFADILEECYYKSRYPIVFICTEVANNKNNLMYNLFPQEVLTKYQITHISFNSCAPTLLKNCLRRAHDLIKKNKDYFQVPSPDTVDAILSSSMGDIRCAVNQYYFASLLGSKEMPTEKSFRVKPSAKRKRNEKSCNIKIMAKDETLGLFHALGRILNPKRKEHGKSWRLNCDLENLITELESQPENVISFLFANYIKYFGDFSELQEASDLISLSQKFFEKWSETRDLHQYPLWISVMGLMIWNSHKVSKWNQIEGPKKFKKNILRTKETLCTLDEFYINIIRKNHNNS
ncbi:hypothetical protein HHI36_015508 [Cryptolaemus montrouzieri]|uniref:Cell cycle checkpoint protein RAD17 n=1 Tax=Cryptolaemus montrouzieri TaxID=559131 RepID=A0ABD2N6N2_9CUCU